MTWKAITILNSLCLILILYFVFVENREMQSRIYILEKENDELAAIADGLRSDIKDLLDRIDYLNDKINRIELDKAVQNMAETTSVAEPEIRRSHFGADISTQVTPETAFSVDMGDCSGVGKGVIGLFVDVFTKCPSDIRGFGINVTR